MKLRYTTTFTTAAGDTVTIAAPARLDQAAASLDLDLAKIVATQYAPLGLAGGAWLLIAAREDQDALGDCVVTVRGHGEATREAALAALSQARESWLATAPQWRLVQPDPEIFWDAAQSAYIHPRESGLQLVMDDAEAAAWLLDREPVLEWWLDVRLADASSEAKQQAALAALYLIRKHATL